MFKSLVANLYVYALSNTTAKYISKVEFTDGGTYLTIGNDRLMFEDFSASDLGAVNPILTVLGFNTEALDTILGGLHILLGSNTAIDLVNRRVEF